MLYLLAIIIPPVAVFLVGRPMQALLNLVLTAFFWIPGAIHAILLVNEKKADDRMKMQAELIAKSRKD